MTWVKLDDGFFDNPKVIAAGDDAALLYLAGLCYCSRHLTDGLVPKAMLGRLTAKRRHDRATEALVTAGLWHDEGDHYRVHDYAAHQRTREEVHGIRDGARRRTALNRNTELRAAIKNRDGDQCRYCGRAVNWNDRRGPAGGTYDHVNPNGPDTLDNLVVACRSCNSAKQHRTPDQAAMPLRPPKSDLDPDLDPTLKLSRPEAETETDTEADVVNGRGSSQSRLPHAWTPPPETIEQLITLGWSRSLQAAEAAKFAASARDRARTSADWTSAYELWIHRLPRDTPPAAAIFHCRNCDRPEPECTCGYDAELDVIIPIPTARTDTQ